MDNMTSIARKKLGLTQDEFSKYIIEREEGRDKPYSKQVIHSWETSAKSPRTGARRVMAPIAARSTLLDIIEAGKNGDYDKAVDLIVMCQR